MTKKEVRRKRQQKIRYQTHARREFKAQVHETMVEVPKYDEPSFSIKAIAILILLFMVSCLVIATAKAVHYL